jgi:hypothetical protein
MILGLFEFAAGFFAASDICTQANKQTAQATDRTLFVIAFSGIIVFTS